MQHALGQFTPTPASPPPPPSLRCPVHRQRPAVGKRQRADDEARREAESGADSPSCPATRVRPSAGPSAGPCRASTTLQHIGKETWMAGQRAFTPVFDGRCPAMTKEEAPFRSRTLFLHDGQAHRSQRSTPCPPHSPVSSASITSRSKWGT